MNYRQMIPTIDFAGPAIPHHGRPYAVEGDLDTNPTVLSLGDRIQVRNSYMVQEMQRKLAVQSRKSTSLRARLGALIFLIALASICLIRSLVTPNTWVICSRV
jgi:hypothetical protein